MFSLLCLFVAFVILHFGLEGRTLVLIVSVPGFHLPLTDQNKKKGQTFSCQNNHLNCRKNCNILNQYMAICSYCILSICILSSTARSAKELL